MRCAACSVHWPGVQDGKIEPQRVFLRSAHSQTRGYQMLQCCCCNWSIPTLPRAAAKDRVKEREIRGGEEVGRTNHLYIYMLSTPLHHSSIFSAREKRFRKASSFTFFPHNRYLTLFCYASSNSCPLHAQYIILPKPRPELFIHNYSRHASQPPSHYPLFSGHCSLLHTHPGAAT